MDAAPPKIGLALSGGGSRAIAFHLGCLRALHDLGLLEHVAVISTVSGGSVIGAYFHAHKGDFASFEKKTREVLARGLFRPMIREMIGPLGLKALGSFLLAGLASIATTAAARLSHMLPGRKSTHPRPPAVSPVRRYVSRSHFLRSALDKTLFKGLRLCDLAETPSLVINATELRTGSAFRFSRSETGSWRWGRLHRNDALLAHAVAASAAYPLLLPAFDETHVFEKNGAISKQRVTLSDGGIYDNLGLGCLWPERTTAVSLHVVPVDTIICCSAGYGLRQDTPTQFLLARMKSVFSTVSDRSQNAAMNRLHEAKRKGEIAQFILPYLGQQDDALSNPPADLVRREQVHAYPTDFNAMSDEWIDLISRRGEQLTRSLAKTYFAPTP